MPKSEKPAEQATPDTEIVEEKSAADEMEDLIAQAGASSEDTPTTPEADASIPDDVSDLTEENLSKLPRGLQDRFRSLQAKEEKYEALQRELESLTDDEVETPQPGTKIKVPEGWEAIQPIIDQLEEKQNRLEQEREGLRKELNDARANIELRSFQSDHTDWKQYEKKMVDLAEETGFEVHDRRTLDILYELVKNKEAAARLAVIERDREIGKKAGASPRFQGPTRTGVREQLAKPNGKMTFEEAGNWALKQMAAGRRTR